MDDAALASLEMWITIASATARLARWERFDMNEREILDRITPRFATREEARGWYESVPVPGFSGTTAQELVAQGRAEEVVEFLAACDAGVYA